MTLWSPVRGAGGRHAHGGLGVHNASLGVGWGRKHARPAPNKPKSVVELEYHTL